MGEDAGISHVLVPVHTLLTKQESEALLKDMGLKPWQLPRITDDDPAIAHLKPEPGLIVKITRKSDLVGEYSVYRVVVAATGTRPLSRAAKAKAKAEKEAKRQAEKEAREKERAERKAKAKSKAASKKSTKKTVTKKPSKKPTSNERG